MKVKSRLAAVAVSLATVAGVGAVVAPPAQAVTYGNVYLVVQNYNCVGGGKINQITGAVDNTWSGGDAGDNIIYPRVDLSRTNTFNGRALCVRPSYSGGPYWINVVGWEFRPTRTGQTFYY